MVLVLRSFVARCFCLASAKLHAMLAGGGRMHKALTQPTAHRARQHKRDTNAMCLHVLAGDMTFARMHKLPQAPCLCNACAQQTQAKRGEPRRRRIALLCVCGRPLACAKKVKSGSCNSHGRRRRKSKAGAWAEQSKRCVAVEGSNKCREQMRHAVAQVSPRACRACRLGQWQPFASGHAEAEGESSYGIWRPSSAMVYSSRFRVSGFVFRQRLGSSGLKLGVRTGSGGRLRWFR